MDILYANTKLQKICENHRQAVKQLGAECAKRLRTRLADLEAATQVTDLVAGNPHPLTGDRAGQFALNLAGGFRLVFSAANDPIPTKPDHGIDWNAVTIVSIEYIGDYHG